MQPSAFVNVSDLYSRNTGLATARACPHRSVDLCHISQYILEYLVVLVYLLHNNDINTAGGTRGTASQQTYIDDICP